MEKYIDIPVYGGEITGFAIIEDEHYRTYRFHIITTGMYPSTFITIPKGHPLYEVDLYDHDIEKGNPLHEISCHGGFTIAKHMLSFERQFVIGWEYCHSGDYYFHASKSDEDKHKWTLDELVSEAHDVIDRIVEKYGETGGAD